MFFILFTQLAEIQDFFIVQSTLQKVDAICTTPMLAMLTVQGKLERKSFLLLLLALQSKSMSPKSENKKRK